MTYLTLYELLGSTKPYTLETTSNSISLSASSVNLLQFTIPEGKLFYPEPFIASASYLHSDLTYLHLFQYWYWLWFLFIFLICFFLISFVSTLRWCTTRIRPRRETRGVSRSKCGDLITACVPVSWAISIIVNESADATDINDGFGTSELVVGVRAYQWGWEYYYPKAIDLNYNVKPSYGSFIGNSLQYNHTSGYTLSSQTLWRMYQNKEDDVVITPAHILFAPLTTTNVLNFEDIGLNTLQESSAFAKIRNSTKAYNTHLTYVPSLTFSKYIKLHSLFFNENNFVSTSSYAIRPQHMFLSSSARSSYPSTNNLDEHSFQKFLKVGVNDNGNSNIKPHLMGSLSNVSSYRNSYSTNLATTFILNQLFQQNNLSFTTLTRELLYPSFKLQFNNDSDKPALNNPLVKWNSALSLNLNYTQPSLAFVLLQANDMTSYASSTFTNFLASDTLTPRQFDINGPNSKVLLGDQSLRSSLPSVPQVSNLNLAASMNTSHENFKFHDSKNRPFNIFLGSLLNENKYVDYRLFSTLASSSSFNVTAQPAIHSLSARSLNSLEHDTTSSYLSVLQYVANQGLAQLDQKTEGLAGDLFVGSREKTPRALNTSYWSTFWTNVNPTHRISTLLALNSQRAHFYLPIFTNYSDYDFRNDQAFDLLEDLFWETSFSSYNFSDYLSLTNSINRVSILTGKDLTLEKYFHKFTLGYDLNSNLSLNSIIKDLSSQSTVYSNSIQMEEYLPTPSHLFLNNYSYLSLYSELSDLEDSFMSFKMFYKWLTQFSTNIFINNSVGFTPRSYISVFNAFRSDLEDFQFYAPESLNFQQPLTELFTVNIAIDNALNSANTCNGANFRTSNPVYLRSSVRNSVVNSNAFQKVFKPRLDESRALVNSSSFAELSVNQPFLSDKLIPYFQLLGKNRTNFFATPFYFSRKNTVFNVLHPLLVNTTSSFYDFPFLLSKTSDTMRFTWLDWFSKWAYIEVQPSSISRYSTIGVPYLRKSFDFNSSTGDKFQDVELYFTRVSRSRRNYLPLWLYTPLLFSRTYIWDVNSVLNSSFLNSSAELALCKHSCTLMHWYWNSPFLRNTAVNTYSYSNSGNNVYSKSTYQPRSSIQSYYTSIATLVDILSHREYLYRLVFSNRFDVSSLPNNLSVNSDNIFLTELRSSFLFSDPSTFSSESTRELLYSPRMLVQLNYIQELFNWFDAPSLSKLSHTLNYQPLNYLTYYFLNSHTSSISQNSELLKSQFRPLKKGISSMLRLHATGAVAMPIEIRLQVLASSRDVIHSWSIPSASVKIDCVPGYTSHKMLKFFLTGVYWGQCQEICGRYHHWMPIVVYFMKRDLFFLWCTHFVFTHTPSSTWDISDRRFANMGRTASYDSSSWLSEFSN